MWNAPLLSRCNARAGSSARAWLVLQWVMERCYRYSRRRMCDKYDHFTWLLIRNNNTITTHSPHPKALTKKFLSTDQKIYWSWGDLFGLFCVLWHRQRNLWLASNYYLLLPFYFLETKYEEPKAVTKGIDNFYQKCHNYQLYGGFRWKCVSEWHWRHSSLALIEMNTRKLNYIAVKNDHLARYWSALCTDSWYSVGSNAMSGGGS